MILKLIEDERNKFIKIGDEISFSKFSIRDDDSSLDILDQINNQHLYDDLNAYFITESKLRDDEDYYLKDTNKIKIVESDNKVYIFKDDYRSKLFLLNDEGQTIEKL